jgi:NifU-like protein
MTLEEAEKVTNADIAEYLGGLPEQKMHCSVMGREALEAAIKNYHTGKKVKLELEGRVVCTCFGVTETEIERVIRDNNLTTVEQVTNYTKAGGGCGGCKGEIAKIIARVRGTPAEAETHKPAKKPLTNIQKIKLIEETIEKNIRPMLRQDGGNIDLIDVDGTRVLVSLRGACAQCRMAEVTMKDVVQAQLREFVSDDIIVEEVKA